MRLVSKVISKLILMVRRKFLVVTVVISLLITNTLVYIFKEQEKSLRIFTQERLSENIAEKHKVEEELRETVTAKNEVENELNEEKERTEKLEVKLEQKNRQISLTLNKLEAEISARLEAEAQLLITLKEKRNLEERLPDVVQKPEAIELNKIVVTTNPLLNGEVLDVNEEYRFILVNLGRADGLSIGGILAVYRNGEFIGKAEVERVEEKTSACSILPAWEQQEFREKDIVKWP